MAASVTARRLGSTGGALAGLVAAVLLALGRPVDALVLTATAAVGIINALWLERALLRVLQPGGPRVTRGTAFLLVARWGLWAALFAALYLVREHVAMWAVVVGVGCFVIALASAGVGAAGEPGEE